VIDKGCPDAKLAEIFREHYEKARVVRNELECRGYRLYADGANYEEDVMYGVSINDFIFVKIIREEI